MTAIERARSPVSIPEPAIVTSILEDGAEATELRFAHVPASSALIEIRADALRRDDLASLIRRAPRPTIVTVRRRQDGGRFDGSEDERRDMLEGALAAGASLIDVEWDGALAGLATIAGPERVVISHHGGACTAVELTRVYRAMAAGPPGRLKIVPRAATPSDAFALRELLSQARSNGRRLAAFASGPAGMPSRVFACAWGSWATYGSAARGLATAEGQPTARDLAEVYRACELGPRTRCFALAGRPIDRSPSPAMHAAAYREIGLDAVFLPLEVERFEDALELCGARASYRVEGLAVTIPFKESAAAIGEAGDRTVADALSANTLVFESGRVAAFNTDAPAALALLSRSGSLDGERAAIVGAGGTARAIAAALRDAGVKVTLFNRSTVRAGSASASLGVATAPLESLPNATWEILVNATPLGRNGEQVIPTESLRGRIVLDAAYGSVSTPLVAGAREAGLTVVDGFDLLGAQAALQFERMTGRSCDPLAMTAVARSFRSLDGMESPA